MADRDDVPAETVEAARRAVAEAPPLTTEQVRTLRTLLAPVVRPSTPAGSTMTEAERAEYYYQHRDDLEGEDVTDQFDIADPLEISIAVRFSRQEANEIRAAADEAGVTVADFVRTACRAKLDS